MAFQVFGGGAFDVLLIGNWASNIEVMWEHPQMARYLNRLGRFARVICFDRRGAGVSDPVPLGALPTLEQWMDDARAVKDAAGTQQAALIGDAESGPMAMMFAATHPDRSRALVVVNTFARMLGADDYPIGMPESAAKNFMQLWESSWGKPITLQLTAPMASGDPTLQRWSARYMRLSAAPLTSIRIYGWILRLDVRSVLPSVRARRSWSIAPGTHTTGLPWGGTWRTTFRERRTWSYLGPTGTRRSWMRNRSSTRPKSSLPASAQRPPTTASWATVLFTDIAGSTELAARLGDQGWRRLRSTHNAIVRSQLGRFCGREVATLGDGFLATFDGPARAVRCAWEIAAGVRPIGIQVRAVLHTGEIEVQ